MLPIDRLIEVIEHRILESQKRGNKLTGGAARASMRAALMGTLLDRRYSWRFTPVTAMLMFGSEVRALVCRKNSCDAQWMYTWRKTQSEPMSTSGFIRDSRDEAMLAAEKELGLSRVVVVGEDFVTGLLERVHPELSAAECVHYHLDQYLGRHR